MRAAYIEQLGSPEQIRYGQLPPPEPGPADVLVDVCATTVNPVDTFVRSGAFGTTTPFPFVIGRDLVGTVAAAGAGVTEFGSGDVVWCNSLGHEGRQGAAAEQAVVAADRLYHLPEGVDPTEAVAVLHPAATAALAMRHGRVGAGQTVLVAGAAGNVGAALVTLAGEAGARVLATCGARDRDYCRWLGAQEAFDYRDPELAARLREHCPGGFDVHVDTSGNADLATTVSLLAERGRAVLLAGAGARLTLPAGPFYMKSCTVSGFVISHASTDELADAARTINRLLAAGKLRSRSVQTIPLESAADAHRWIEAGELHGKRVVLQVR